MTTDDEPNNKASGDQTTINTGGGDYAEGNIDKRQGAVFVENSAVFNQPGWNVGGNVYNVAGDLKVGATPVLASALHQLRAPVGDFVGREQEIDQLVQALTRGGGAAITGVRGMGGIGKTELAYVVANRIVSSFPDAQLVINLHGASDCSPLTPIQALQRVIRVFEPEARLFDDLDQLQAHYRSLLTGRRALLLADDAQDAAQVRPFLPPPGCALLVTSRNRFSLPGMFALDLGTLSPAEAETLVLGICSRIGDHAAELAKLCGYLPLALRVSASLLANSSHSVKRHLEQLNAERLKHLSDPDTPDDPQASVEASLRLSYAALEEAAQQALCQLSVFPTSFDQAAALAVVEVAGDAEALLDLLQRRSLLDQNATSERLNLHDLVRAFAAVRLKDADAVRLRHAQHYARVAQRAGELYLQGGEAFLAGLALFDQERAHIDAVWSWAREQVGNWDADALLLEYTDATIYIGDLRYDKRHERIPQFEAQLAAARRVRRQDLEGYALGNLGSAYRDLGEPRQAIAFYEQALVIARELGDRRGEGGIQGNLGCAYRDLGEPRQAIEFYQQSLVIARELGDRRGEGAALNNLGMAYESLGKAREAIGLHEQHLNIARELGDRREEGNALGNLGSAYAALGEARKAIDFYEQDLAVAREIGDRRGQGYALAGIGSAFRDLGEAPKAIEFYEPAVVIAREIGDRGGESITSWNLGDELAKQGNLARAAELMQVCVDYLRELGHPDAEKRAARLEQVRQRLAARAGEPHAASQNPPSANAPDEW